MYNVCIAYRIVIFVLCNQHASRSAKIRGTNAHCLLRSLAQTNPNSYSFRALPVHIGFRESTCWVVRMRTHPPKESGPFAYCLPYWASHQSRSRPYSLSEKPSRTLALFAKSFQKNEFAFLLRLCAEAQVGLPIDAASCAHRGCNVL